MFFGFGTKTLKKWHRNGSTQKRGIAVDILRENEHIGDAPKAININTDALGKEKREKAVFCCIWELGGWTVEQCALIEDCSIPVFPCWLIDMRGWKGWPYHVIMRISNRFIQFVMSAISTIYQNKCQWSHNFGNCNHGSSRFAEKNSGYGKSHYPIAGGICFRRHFIETHEDCTRNALKSGSFQLLQEVLWSNLVKIINEDEHCHVICLIQK